MHYAKTGRISDISSLKCIPKRFKLMVCHSADEFAVKRRCISIRLSASTTLDSQGRMSLIALQGNISMISSVIEDFARSGSSAFEYNSSPADRKPMIVIQNWDSIELPGLWCILVVGSAWVRDSGRFSIIEPVRTRNQLPTCGDLTVHYTARGISSTASCLCSDLQAGQSRILARNRNLLYFLECRGVYNRKLQKLNKRGIP